jgi:hypothetical protein
MTESQADRHVHEWLAAREPGPMPAALRESLRRVAYETPPPATWRLWQGTVRPGWAGTTSSLRLALLIGLLGVLIALTTANLIGDRSPAPALAPELSRWRDFVVGQRAPALEFRSVGGALSDRDDMTLQFEDLLGSLVVMYVPEPDAEQGITDVGGLAEATLAAPDSTAFIVTGPIEWSRGLNLNPEVVNAEPPPGWEAARPQRGPAILVVDRRGVVAAVYASTLPTPDQLADRLVRVESAR